MKIRLDRLDIAWAKSGKTRTELGNLYNSIRNAKRGESIRPKTVYKIAEALGCTTDYLLGCDKKAVIEVIIKVNGKEISKWEYEEGQDI